jgi:hypothetical protein
MKVQDIKLQAMSGQILSFVRKYTL